MVEKQDTLSKVSDIVASVRDMDKNAIDSDKSFDEIGADSLDMLEIIMKCEEVFSIEISDEQAEKMTSIEKAVTIIEKIRSKNK